MLISYFKRRNISLLLVVSLLLLNYLPFYISWLLLFLLSVALFIFSHKKHFEKTIDNPLLALVAYVLFIAIVGIANIFSSGVWAFVRDLIYASKPLLCVYVFLFIGKRFEYSKEVLYRSFFLYSSIICTVFIVTRIFKSDVGRPEEWALAFGLYLVLCKRTRYINLFFDCVFSLLIIAGFAFAFSRTSLLILGVLVILSTSEYRRTIPRLLALATIVVVAGLIIQKDAILSYLQDIGRSLTEINSNNIWDSYEIVNNWRGFEIYCAKTMYSNGSLGNKLFGFGAGSFIDCFGYSYLVTGESGLPFLHNGYYTVLIKNGVFGILLLGAFAILNFVFVKKNVSCSRDRKVLYALIIAMFASMWVISGVFCGSQLEFCILFYWLAKSKNSITSTQRIEILHVKRTFISENLF